jgi:hypothetical protein
LPSLTLISGPCLAGRDAGRAPLPSAHYITP